MSDSSGLLEKPGKNSQAARLIRFTNVERIKETMDEIKSYVYEAVEIEKAGLKVGFKKHLEPIPDELELKFREDPIFKAGFEGLTPGRQRGYVLYFSQPKQSKTMESRIEKCVGKILNGEGLHDKYKRTNRR